MKPIRIIYACSILLIVFAFISMPALAEYYQYTDKNGNISFTDNISDVPPDQRTNAKSFKSVQKTQYSNVDNQSNNLKEDKIVLYYNKETSMKIINDNGFLMKMITENGLETYYELGDYPDDYPKDLPLPMTHIDKD
jgi:hypothetical protein